MPLGLPFTRCLRIVDDGYKPVRIVPNVEDDVAIDKIGILEHAVNVIKIPPANRLVTTALGFSCGLGTFPPS